MANDHSTGPMIDEATGTSKVGHEWDGIEELDTPMPRWWVWLYWATIIFAIGYCIAYPAWPLLSKGTEGMLGWTSRGQLSKELSGAEQARQAQFATLASTPLEDIAADPALLQTAVAGGAAAFKVNCVQCHGAGAAGSPGYPNLNDDDWLWGGDLAAIQQTIVHGVRHPGDDATRFSQMPAFGRDGLLSAAEIGDVASYVLTLSGKEQPSAASARGAVTFEAQCAICHGADGTGSREFGAPNLADAIALYGGSGEALRKQINNPAHGVMPAWGERLDPVTIKMLAAYVHSLGGGEAFVEVATPELEAPVAPEAGADEQP